MKKFWKSMGMGVVYFAAFMGIQFWVTLAGVLLLMGNLIRQEGMDLFLNPDTFTRLYMNGLVEHMTLIILISNLVSLGIMWVVFRARGSRLSKEVGLQKTSRKNLLMSVFFGIGVCFLIDLMTQILPVPESMMEQFETEHGMLWFGDAGLTFLSVALVGPVSEEVFFRGLCYSRMKRGMKPWLAGLLSSVLFGIAHGNPVWFLVGLVAGLALSWAYETTGSLWNCIVIHITNNAISSLTAYVPLPDGLRYGLTLISLALLIVSTYFLWIFNKEPETAVSAEEN